MKDIRYQEQCANCDCDIWIKDGVRHVICPHCGAKLNEYSSEDADEGKFSKINPCPQCQYSEPEVLDMAEFDYINTDNDRYWVACRKCGYCAMGCSPTKEMAIEKWNAINEENLYDLPCPGCGMIGTHSSKCPKLRR
jgi:predicted RNA-binding Zn-ribbon protein involved in translation (DUF1610 family)